MSLEIFWGSGSPYSWRVMLTAELKKANYLSRRLYFSEKDSKKPDYLAINPRGKVPALRDGDFVLTESVAIIVYLDRKFPDPPLFGDSAEHQARIWEMIGQCVSYFEPEAGKIVDPIFNDAVETYAERMQRAGEALHAEFAALEKALADQEWLVGDAVSAADLTVYPWLEFLLRISAREAAQPLKLGFHPMGARYPDLQSWRERMTTIPGYEKAYPPHWREDS